MEISVLCVQQVIRIGGKNKKQMYVDFPCSRMSFLLRILGMRSNLFKKKFLKYFEKVKDHPI